MNEELIFCVLKKLDNNNNGIVLNKVIDYLKPFLKYMVNNLINTGTNSNYFVNLDMFMSQITSCVNEGCLLFKNNKYYINYDCLKYKNYIKNELNSNTSFEQLLQSLNFLAINNDQDEKVEDNCSEDDTSEQFNECYVIESTSTYDYHLINLELTICSCKSYEYCKSAIKTCKHLKSIMLENRSELALKYPIFNTEEKICTCTEFQDKNNCIHYTSLKKYGY